jgi:prophage regulatory protein
VHLDVQTTSIRDLGADINYQQAQFLSHLVCFIDYTSQSSTELFMSVEHKGLQILRMPQVIERTGLSRSTIYQAISEGRFPKPINLSARAVGWIESEIDDWISLRITESRM